MRRAARGRLWASNFRFATLPIPASSKPKLAPAPVVSTVKLPAMANRIHQLPPDVANRIAAGEVIERPANAVKELVENALDAGARRITIELEEGGKKLIRVRDDGSGMTSVDAVLCLQRHATSKISGAEDLWKVQTLGFRGEALPSIAAVARLEITTREADADAGTRLIAEASVILDVSETGCAPGTEITVRNLFFNTPARFKFLKSDAAEAARTNEMIGHLALAYPHVAFVLTHNGNESLRVEAGGDPFNALVAVMGSETARAMLPISTADDTPGLKVSGFTARPQTTRANRNGQIFFVNGRAIKSRTLQHAFGAAYEGLVHGRDRHPMGVIMIRLAPGSVDVNVHPTKSEVRFAREGEVHHAVRVAVRDTLVSAQLAPSWGFAGEGNGGLTGPFGRPMPSDPASGQAISGQASPGTPPADFRGYHQPVIPGGAGYGHSSGRTYGDNGSGSGWPGGARSTGNASGTEEPQPAWTNPFAKGAPLPDPLQPLLIAPPEEDEPRLRLRALAQITHNSYILCEAEDGLFIVNQHRAHERILADRAMDATEGRRVESQRLVIPFTVEAGARALAAVEEHGRLLLELGFEVEPFGGSSLLVRAVPYLVAQDDYEQAFADLLEELLSGHAGSDLHERRRALLTMLSCRSAIKAGDPLRPEQMQKLIDDLVQVQNPSICPHGQPILIKISTWELHKKFEREYARR